MATNGARIVDADGHVLEPPTGMAERAPARFRDRIWHIDVRPDGSEWLRYNGHERPTRGMALAGRGRHVAGGSRPRPARRAPLHRRPRRRVRAAARVCTTWTSTTSRSRCSTRRCSSACPSLADLEFAEVQADAYNEWLADYCAARADAALRRRRVVPQQDVERAVRVIRRARELRPRRRLPAPEPVGRRDASSTTRPTTRSGPCARSSTCRSASIPFLAPDMPGACRALGYYRLPRRGHGLRRADDGAARSGNMANIFFSQAISNPFDMMETLTLLIVRRRARALPALKVHLPRGQRRLDRAVARAPRPPLRGLPLGRAVAEDEAVGVLPPPVLDLLRPRRVDARLHRAPARWSAPIASSGRATTRTPTRRFPGVVDELREATRGARPSRQRARILGLNAAELYGLPAEA